jgi:hypothetical protein
MAVSHSRWACRLHGFLTRFNNCAWAAGERETALLSFRDAAKRRTRNPDTSGFPAFLDSGLAPLARPGMTAESFSAACERSLAALTPFEH